MRSFRILFQRELRAYFLSPIAWVVIGMVMAMTGVLFWFLMDRLRDSPSAQSLLYLTFNAVPFWLYFFFLFPLITMRLFAEEQKMGTLETLLTAPVRTWEVIMSKYLAAVVFYLVLWFPSMLNFQLFQWFTGESAAFSTGAFFGSYLILVLMGLLNIAIGCLASALTSDQIIAAVVCFAAVIIHFLFGFLKFFRGLTEEVSNAVSYVSVVEHMARFTTGLIDTRQIVYYTSFSLLILFITHHVLEYRRWKL